MEMTTCMASRPTMCEYRDRALRWMLFRFGLKMGTNHPKYQKAKKAINLAERATTLGERVAARNAVFNLLKMEEN